MCYAIQSALFANAGPGVSALMDPWAYAPMQGMETQFDSYVTVDPNYIPHADVQGVVSLFTPMLLDEPVRKPEVVNDLPRRRAYALMADQAQIGGSRRWIAGMQKTMRTDFQYPSEQLAFLSHISRRLMNGRTPGVIGKFGPVYDVMFRLQVGSWMGEWIYAFADEGFSQEMWKEAWFDEALAQSLRPTVDLILDAEAKLALHEDIDERILMQAMEAATDALLSTVSITEVARLHRMFDEGDVHGARLTQARILLMLDSVGRRYGILKRRANAWAASAQRKHADEKRELSAFVAEHMGERYVQRALKAAGHRHELAPENAGWPVMVDYGHGDYDERMALVGEIRKATMRVPHPANDNELLFPAHNNGESAALQLFWDEVDGMVDALPKMRDRAHVVQEDVTVLDRLLLGLTALAPQFYESYARRTEMLAGTRAHDALMKKARGLRSVAASLGLMRGRPE